MLKGIEYQFKPDFKLEQKVILAKKFGVILFIRH